MNYVIFSTAAYSFPSSRTYTSNPTLLRITVSWDVHNANFFMCLLTFWINLQPSYRPTLFDCCVLAYSRSRVYRRICSRQERSSNLGQDTEVRVPKCRNNVIPLHWIHIRWSLLDESNLVTIRRRVGNGNTPLTNTSSSAPLDVLSAMSSCSYVVMHKSRCGFKG